MQLLVHRHGQHFDLLSCSTDALLTFVDSYTLTHTNSSQIKNQQVRQTKLSNPFPLPYVCY